MSRIVSIGAHQNKVRPRPLVGTKTFIRATERDMRDWDAVHVHHEKVGPAPAPDATREGVELAVTRSKEFGLKLSSLVNEYSDVPAPRRCKLMFAAMCALTQSFKGEKLSAEDIAFVCAEFTRSLFAGGLVDR